MKFGSCWCREACGDCGSTSAGSSLRPTPQTGLMGCLCQLPSLYEGQGSHCHGWGSSHLRTGRCVGPAPPGLSKAQAAQCMLPGWEPCLLVARTEAALGRPERREGSTVRLSGLVSGVVSSTGSSDLGTWKGHLLVLSGEGRRPAYVCPVQQLPF